jgi:hypothetical protein
MSKAAQLAARLEQTDVAEGINIIEGATEEAIHFDVMDDAMCIMHSDGSVNIIDQMSKGREVISPANILKVLKHYRPFKEIFKGNMQ